MAMAALISLVGVQGLFVVCAISSRAAVTMQACAYRLCWQTFSSLPGFALLHALLADTHAISEMIVRKCLSVAGSCMPVVHQGLLHPITVLQADLSQLYRVPAQTLSLLRTAESDGMAILCRTLLINNCSSGQEEQQGWMLDH